MRAGFRRGPSSLCRNLILIFGFAIAFQLTRLIIKQLELPLGESSQSAKRLSGTKNEFKRVIPGPSSDESGKYNIHRFYKSEGFGTKMINKDVTMVTHCTVDQMYHLMEMSDRWDGPMSVAIYAPGLDASFADDAIDGLRLCWPVLREFMTFHLVYPKEAPANMTNTGTFAYLSCKDVTRRLMTQKSELQTNANMINQLEYPHNLLRNIAKQTSLTEYVLVADIGMVPSENLRNVFVEFAHANNLFDRKSEMAKLNEKTAYALATYEIRTENQTPRDKGELQVMVKDKNARVLMQEICWFCQKPLDYDKWIQGSKEEEFGIAYAVPFTRTWMPFFIVKRNVVPDYDERFNLYGYDRLVHMCELHKREFSFQVLNQAFMVSRGFRAKSSLSADERRVRDDWQEFKDNFSSALTKFGYTDEAYQQC